MLNKLVTNTKLKNVLNTTNLEFCLKEGLIRRQTHPKFPFAIYNYSQTCQFSKNWTHETLTCRGLITLLETQGADFSHNELVVGRPWTKFFNYGEHPDLVFPSGKVVVTDKVDGSLGILFPLTPNEYAIATRGSFTSDQAIHATSVLKTKYSNFTPNPAWTYLFEIIYPENRIVVSYGNFDDLVLLGAVEITTGLTVDFEKVQKTWPGPVVTQFDYQSIEDALLAPDRPNAEGFVVYFEQNNMRVKIKQEDYVALHKVLTGLTEKRVWEVLVEEGNVNTLLEIVPDEMFTWIQEVAAGLLTSHQMRTRQLHEQLAQVHTRFAVAKALAPNENERKLLAQIITQYDSPGHLFSLHDGKDIAGKLWKDLQPAGNTTPFDPEP